jgi:hypothetical protein
VVVGKTIRGLPVQDNGSITFGGIRIQSSEARFFSNKFRPLQILLLPYPK